MLWKPTWIFPEEHTQPQHAARQLAAGEAGRAAAASVGAADSEVRGLAAWREIGVEVSDGGILIPPPNLREILSMRMNWFWDHLKGEKLYWKNKDGKPLEVTISSIHSTGFSHDKYYNHYNCSFFPLHSASGLGFGYFLFPNIFLGTYIYSSCFDSMYLITARKTPIIWRSSSRISDWARHGPPINTCLLGSWRWPIFYPG